MSSLAKSVDALYFDYRPVAGHLEGCRFHGTDTWEVTRHTRESFSGERYEETIRLACHECGVVHFRGPFEGPGSFETTHADQVGYAGKPERVAGIWLHPGPRIWYGDDRGPQVYLVTASKEPPRRPEDVLGKVGWTLGSRGGVRWSAGLGCTGHGTVLRGAEQTWTSRRAAVAWVIAAAEHARARCETCGASGADEALEKTTWTALADGSKTDRWFCRDRRACNDRRFPELPRMLGEAGGDR